MSGFKIFNSEKIAKALSDVKRVYLVGNLKEKEKLDFIKKDELEIGISSYKTSLSEVSHFHPVCDEFQLILSGYTEYMDLETHEVFKFKKDDFYMISSGTKYAQKVKSGTKILFIKTPSKNDKTLVEDDEKALEFLSHRIESIRKDYYHEADSPVANSVRPSVSGAIINNNKILLLKRKDNNKWTLPGGTVEHFESCEQALVREIKEECNLDVEVLSLLKIYDDPEVKIEYLDGEVRREFTVVYVVKSLSFDVKTDEESIEFKWADVDELEDLDFTLSQRKRILDVVKYINEHPWNK